MSLSASSLPESQDQKQHPAFSVPDALEKFGRIWASDLKERLAHQQKVDEENSKELDAKKTMEVKKLIQEWKQKGGCDDAEKINLVSNKLKTMNEELHDNQNKQNNKLSTEHMWACSKKYRDMGCPDMTRAELVALVPLQQI